MEIRRCLKCMHELRAEETVCPHCGREYGTSQAEHYALKPGTILDGKYLVGEMLGQGGFGITYVGFDLLLEQKVAIKEYFPTGLVTRMGSSTVLWNSTMMQKTGTEKGFESFLKEARKMAKLGAIPGVVGVKTVFIENETAYIVMDYVEGETLLNKLQREGRMDFSTCVRLLTPIMQALAQVHQHGIIHRDISPDNIMVKKDGSLVLLDLGAAKDLEIKDNNGNTQHSSQLVAKHGFSPLEQYSTAGNVGSWTDVYAMAATIYYCCTQSIPPTSVERVLNDTLACKPLLTEPEFRILQKAMAVKSENRYQTMGELLTALTGTKDDSQEKRRKEEADCRRLKEERRRDEEKRQRDEEERRREEAERRKAEEERRQEKERQKEAEAVLKREAAMKRLKKWLLPAGAGAVLVLILVLYVSVIRPGNQYKQALAMMERGECQEAIAAFEALGDYKDSAAQRRNCLYAKAVSDIRDFGSQFNYIYSDTKHRGLLTAEEFALVVKSENVRDLLPLGTRIEMLPRSSKISDEAIEFELVAYQHFPLADGSGMAKTTWLAVDLLNERREMNTENTNAGGWRDSDMRQWLNETLYPSLPGYWKSLMVQVEVSSTAGEKSAETVTSRDHLFLPARGEVDEWYLTSDDASAFYRSEIPSGAEEMTFTRFTDKASRVKKRQGGAVYWWLRSPLAGSSDYFAGVYNNGTSFKIAGNANSSGGVCPGFCM